MKLLYLTARRLYGPRLREVNNTYRAAVAGLHPNVVLGGPGFDVDSVVPINVPEYIRRNCPDVTAVFISDPWHIFWEPCDVYPDCPPVYSGIDQVEQPVVLESGDSQFYHGEVIQHLQARRDRAVCIRAWSHAWRFDARHSSQEGGPPADLCSRTFYLPHGVYDEMLDSARGVEKTHDVFFSGSEVPSSYPARARIAKALRSAPDIRTDWLAHPSDVSHSVIGPAFWRRAAGAHIGVAGTNCYQNLTMRYLEIPACGTLAIGDLPRPEAEQDRWAEHMIDIGSLPSEGIVSEIRRLLAAKDELAQRTTAATEFVVSRHSFKAHFQRVFDEIESWICTTHE